MFVGNTKKELLAWSSFIFLTEMVFENIPQFFIQIINNNKSDGWDAFEVFSVILTAAIIIYETINYSFETINYHCLGIQPEDAEA
jgi:hypothetical protein